MSKSNCGMSLGSSMPPRADRARSLERQPPLVAQVDLEQPAVVLSAARDDRLDRAGEVAEPAVLAVLGSGVLVAEQRRRADAAAQQRQLGVDRRVRPGDGTGSSTATVLIRRRYCPGLSMSNSHSGHVDLAGTRGPQLQQRQRVEPGERDVLGQLVLAPVLLEVGELQPARSRHSCSPASRPLRPASQ